MELRTWAWARVHARSLPSSITYSSVHLRSVPGFSGSCVGSVTGGGMLTVCPHTAPASARRLLLQFKSVAQQQANVSLLTSSTWQRVVYAASPFHATEGIVARMKGEIFSTSVCFHHAVLAARQEDSFSHLVKVSLYIAPLLHLLDYTGPLSCPRDHNSSTPPAHKPSSDVTDYIRMHIRTNI